MQNTSEILRFQQGQRSQHPTPVASVEPLPASILGEQLVVLVDLEPPHPHRSRELRAIVIDAYTRSSGSVVARLRRALAEANRHLADDNVAATFEGQSGGSLTCAVIAGEELFIGQVGPGQALVYTPAEPVLIFPRQGRAVLPLGASLPPVIHIGYAPWLAGSTLLVATGAAMAAQAHERWIEVLSGGALKTVAPLVETAMATSQVTGTLVLTHCGDSQSPLPAPPSRRQWPFHKPTAAPIATAPPSHITPEPPAEPEMPIAPVTTLPPSAPPVTPEPEPEPEAKPPRVWDTFSIKLPALGRPTIQWPKLRLRLPRRQRVGAALRKGWLRLRALFQALGSALLPGQVASNRRRAPRPIPKENPTLMGGLTLGLLLLTMFIMLITYFESGGAGRAQELLIEAQSARALAYNTQAVADWERVRQLSAASLQLDSESVEAQTLLTEAQQAINALESAALLAVYPLQELGTTPTSRRLLVAGGWAYVLNTAADEVLGIPLTADGLAPASDAATPILRRGQLFYGQPVERLVDLAWVQSPFDYPDGAVFVYSDGGVIYIYEPTLGPESITRQTLPDPLLPGAVTLIEAHGNRLYVLNRSDNQILSYRPINGLYDNPGRLYFAPETAPSLQTIVDINADERMYLLGTDGALQVYIEGAEDLSFEVQRLPDTELSPALFTLESDLEAGHIYLGDPQRGRIVVLDKRGNFQHQFQLSGTTLLRNLEALAVDERTSVLYFIAENRLYAAPIPDFVR